MSFPFSFGVSVSGSLSPFILFALFLSEVVSISVVGWLDKFGRCLKRQAVPGGLEKLVV